MKRLLIILLFSTGFFAASAQPSTPPSGDLPPIAQEAYIWQRAWNEPVRDAIALHATNFTGLVVLNAEVTWKQGHPQVIHIPIDYASLLRAACPVGLALRIGPYPGPFTTNGQPMDQLAGLAVSLIAEAQANRLKIRELQIDFDCAESKLDGYRVWVETLRRRIAPVPLVITALPSWLNQNSFQYLARASDGYILQVHSLERPRDFASPFSLCDPAAARRAVEQAGQIDVPFRVALPTYGYLIAFAPDGHFIGLSAEGPAKTWPAGTRLREVRSDPVAMADLVRGWSLVHPAALQKIIWYRFPISLDVLNWSWPTLNAVKTGRSPRESFRLDTSRSAAGLTEISLVNDGEADLSSRPVIEVRWQHARLVASDGLRDFEVVDPGPNTLQFRARTTLIPSRLAPGERQAIGWLRLDGEVEVQIETKKP
ncbi:MAG: hypothetical protein JWR19_1701 [Pedosphaera sp.]|nr:hypothetical protein [Pedosphaera sp.]